jgi:hypothetical protein
VATAIAEAISSSSNGCADAVAAVKAEDIQRKVASAVATASASACSTGESAAVVVLCSLYV